MSNSTIAAATFLLMRARKRTCPKCGRMQTVAAKDILKTQPCSHCGTAVPPKQRVTGRR